VGTRSTLPLKVKSTFSQDVNELLQLMTLPQLQQEVLELGMENPPTTSSKCRELILAHRKNQNIRVDAESKLDNEEFQQSPGTTVTDLPSAGQNQQPSTAVPRELSHPTSEIAQLCVLFSEQIAQQNRAMTQQQRQIDQQQRTMEQLLVTLSQDRERIHRSTPSQPTLSSQPQEPMVHERPTGESVKFLSQQIPQFSATEGRC